MQNAEMDFISCILLRELYNLVNKTYCTRVLYDRTAKTLKRMGSQDTGPRILLLQQSCNNKIFSGFMTKNIRKDMRWEGKPLKNFKGRCVTISKNIGLLFSRRNREKGKAGCYKPRNRK